ncbi:unnamed protein product [Ceratitis capitata]|uniref:(Mediterranean fruit fly) hypothetical protein n=1 Tax=Ceratitis capitata TaxID=7213 RepID=A0A811UJ77_CERCA|nr:unnamed protein product [Ceratitis capitata]
MVKKMEVTQHSKYTCTFCGKVCLDESRCVGIWSCKRCKRVVAGGAWVYSTTAAASVRSAVRRLRETKEHMFIYCEIGAVCAIPDLLFGVCVVWPPAYGHACCTRNNRKK